MKGQMYIVGALFISLALIGIYSYLQYPGVSIFYRPRNCQAIPDAYLNGKILSALHDGDVLLARNGTNIEVYEKVPGKLSIELNNTWFSVDESTNITIPTGNFSVYFNGYSFVFGENDFLHYICSGKHFYMAD